MAFLDNNGLLYLWSKIVAQFVAKAEGKGLSTNDYTTTEKNKLAGLSNYTLPTASSSVLGGVKVGAGLAINGGILSATGGGTADSVDWSNVQNKPTIPTDNNQLANGAGYQTAANVTSYVTGLGYQTAANVTSAITAALSDITGISFEIVATLPATGDAGKFYLVSNSGTGQNVYDEYIYCEGAWEFIGTTAVTVTAITNGEIDTIVA